MNLPKGACEIPLVIQDRSFAATGQLVYTNNMMGETGNTTLVNGPNTRFYQLALTNNQSFQVIDMRAVCSPRT